MNGVINIPVDELKRRRDVRPLSDATVEAIAGSIETIGLVNPLRVRRVSDCFEIVAGSHRFAACDSLGWREIPCFIVDDDDLHAELAMIDENLCRAELSPVDRARQTARRKAIYLELHPGTAHGGDRKSDQVDNLSTRSFADATAAITGTDARTVRRDAERGEKVSDEAANILRGTKLDTGAYLDKLKRVDVQEQVAAVKRDLAAPKPQGGIASRYQQADTKPDPARSAGRFIDLADQIEAIPVTELVASGRLRATVGQRAEGVAMRMDEIKEHLER